MGRWEAASSPSSSVFPVVGLLPSLRLTVTFSHVYILQKPPPSQLSAFPLRPIVSTPRKSSSPGDGDMAPERVIADRFSLFLSPGLNPPSHQLALDGQTAMEAPGKAGSGTRQYE
jgi:hypothetical protein